jgi:hypothetical protein
MAGSCLLGRAGDNTASGDAQHAIRLRLRRAPAASDGLWAVGWLVTIAVAGYVWALWLYRRRTTG